MGDARSFTSFLDLVERVLQRDGFDHVRLDGTMSQKQREAVLKQFNRSKTSLVMIVSTKSGGVGLNLVRANRVYMMDTWWNEAVELQAIDRYVVRIAVADVLSVHRFGQEKDVEVVRFLVKDSIEEKMILLRAFAVLIWA